MCDHLCPFVLKRSISLLTSVMVCTSSQVTGFCGAALLATHPGESETLCRLGLWYSGSCTWVQMHLEEGLRHIMEVGYAVNFVVR
jgi:hypothetical protein